MVRLVISSTKGQYLAGVVNCDWSCTLAGAVILQLSHCFVTGVKSHNWVADLQCASVRMSLASHLNYHLLRLVHRTQPMDCIMYGKLSYVHSGFISVTVFLRRNSGGTSIVAVSASGPPARSALPVQCTRINCSHRAASTLDTRRRCSSAHRIRVSRRPYGPGSLSLDHLVLYFHTSYQMIVIYPAFFTIKDQLHHQLRLILQHSHQAPVTLVLAPASIFCTFCLLTLLNKASLPFFPC